MIAIEVQQINQDKVVTMFFIIEKAEETNLDFLHGTMKISCIYFTLIYQYKMTHYNTLKVKLK